MSESPSSRASAEEPLPRMPSEEPLHPLPASPPSEKRPRKRKNETLVRWGTAAVLVPAVLYIIALGGLAYLVTVVVITLLGQSEFYRLIEDKGAHPNWSLGLSAGAAIPVVAYVGTDYQATILMTAFLLALMVAQLGKAQVSEALASISGTFFGVFYVGWLLSHAIPLRHFYDATHDRYRGEDLVLLGLTPDSGIFLMVFVLWTVVWCDAGAYFAGRAYGRRKLAPQISPGKSVEGALGGVIMGSFGGLGAKLLFDFFWPELSACFPWRATIPFAIVLSLVGITGDLVESLIKRDAKVKDTGALLPGMGGVLDRIDAPLLAIPVMYYMMMAYVFLRIG